MGTENSVRIRFSSTILLEEFVLYNFRQTSQLTIASAAPIKPIIVITVALCVVAYPLCRALLIFQQIMHNCIQLFLVH